MYYDTLVMDSQICHTALGGQISECLPGEDSALQTTIVCLVALCLNNPGTGVGSPTPCHRAVTCVWLALVSNTRASFRKRCGGGGKSMGENIMGGRWG